MDTNTPTVALTEDAACSQDENSLPKLSTTEDKAIQVDMDASPDEDPKKNKKYWQDLAGLRGAREEYLKFDISELAVENRRLSKCVDFLCAKLEWAEKQIANLEAKKCCCRDEEEKYTKPLGSLCL